MPEQSEFDDSIRREERASLHSELLARLEQKGVRLDAKGSDAEVADLLSAIDNFDGAVELSGGDTMVDSPDSSEPERPEWVLPHPRDDESVASYTMRVNSAAERLKASAGH
ncbi:MAG: hypothetical protein ABI026_02775 [Gemmatimonadaceae bacterium]